jgi:hypothetical protein
LLSGAIGLGVALVFAGVAFVRHSPAGALFVVLALVYALVNGLAIRRYLRGQLEPK